MIQRHGFVVVPSAAGFLGEFSQLKVRWETNPNPLEISGSLAAGGVDPGWYAEYVKSLGFELTPVGEYSNMTICIDPSGELWGGFDDEYGHEGSLIDLVRSIFLEPVRPFDRRVEITERPS